MNSDTGRANVEYWHLSAVIVVMLVAVCEPDLIHCLSVEPRTEIWKSVEECQADKAWILAEVEALHPQEKAVMGKCKLVLDEGRRYRRALLAEMNDSLDEHLF